MKERIQVTRELRFRRRFVMSLFIMAAVIMIWRAVDLQFHEVEFLQSHGDARYLRIDEIHANRGMIVDRNGLPLAISSPALSVWVRPKPFIADKSRWSEVVAVLGTTIEHLETLILPRSNRHFVYLKRHITPEQGAALKALEVAGLELQGEYRRYYPAAEVTAHVVGFTNVDDHGQEGIEREFEDVLRGEPGQRRVIKDRLGRVVEDVERLQETRPGRDIVLSIDNRVQYAAYRELKNAVHKHRARAGSLVVVEAHSGEVIAMVNQPSFNPNNRSDRKDEHYRNRAVTDLFEPGSTIKPFTISAALESDRFTPASEINTAPGKFKLGQHTVRDIRNFGVLDISGVIEKSSNVGASKLALSMEPERLWRALRAVGVGSTSDIALPGETFGRLREYEHWREIEHATLAFGYGMSLTAVQLARAYTSIANDGWLLPLSILKTNEVGYRERAFAASTAGALRLMLKKVIEQGTGQMAKVPGYSVAGKTGTVHKATVEGYAEDLYLSLFAGMIPADKPKLVAVVVIDEPRAGEHFGGRVAAPIFSSVMSAATRILDIAPDLPAEDGVPMWLAQRLEVTQPVDGFAQ